MNMCCFLHAVYTQQLQLNHLDGELVVCRMLDLMSIFELGEDEQKWYTL